MMLTYLQISQFLPSTYLNLSFITHGDQLLSMSEEREIQKTDQYQSGKVQEQRSAPDNVVIINYQIIINGMDIANESLKQYSELIPAKVR